MTLINKSARVLKDSQNGTMNSEPDQVKDVQAGLAEDDKLTIELELDGIRLPCDQRMLAESSDYFKAMFSGSYIENGQNVITLKDVNPVDMKLALSLISQGEAMEDLTLGQALGCLQISSMFQFHNLQREIENHLSYSNLLNVNSCLCIAQTAEALMVPHVAERAVVFSLWKFMEVQHTGAFLELNFEEVQKYLSSDMLFSPNGEMEVFDAASRWLDYNKHSHPLEVLTSVRYQFLSTDELNVILNNNLVKNYPKLVKVIMDIIKEKRIENAEKNCLHEAQANIIVTDGDDDRSKLEVKDIFLDVDGTTKRITSYPRCTPLVPCFAGCIIMKDNGKPQETPRKPKLFAFCFDEARKEKLYPFLPIEDDAVGCAIVSGGDRIFTVGGELILGQGKWNKTIQCYDVWRKKWTYLTNTTPRRHHSVVLIGDDVYLLCGIGRFRVVLHSFQKYNISTDEWTDLEPLPQSAYSVAACEHEGSIFVAHNESLCYQYSLSTGTWTQLPARFPPAAGFTSALSYGEFIYLTGPYSCDLYKFRPERNAKAGLVGHFTYGANNTCLVGRCIYSFTAEEGIVYVERYDIWKDEFSVVWTSKEASLPFEVQFIRQLSAFSTVNCLKEISLL